MKKLYTAATILIIIALIFLFVFNKGKQEAMNQLTIEKQDQQIEVQNDIIETKKQQQRIANKPYTDSKSRIKWLHLVWKKRNNFEG